MWLWGKSEDVPCYTRIEITYYVANEKFLFSLCLINQDVITTFSAEHYAHTEQELLLSHLELGSGR